MKLTTETKDWEERQRNTDLRYTIGKTLTIVPDPYGTYGNERTTPSGIRRQP